MGRAGLGEHAVRVAGVRERGGGRVRSGGFRLRPGHAHLDHLSGHRVQDQHDSTSPVDLPVERPPIAPGSGRSAQLCGLGKPTVHRGGTPFIRKLFVGLVVVLIARMAWDTFRGS